MHTCFVGSEQVLVHNAKCNKPNSSIWTNKKPHREKKTNGKTGKKKRYYEWDNTHGDIEVYDARGRHLGTQDPITGEIIKPSVGNGKIEKLGIFDEIFVQPASVLFNFSNSFSFSFCSCNCGLSLLNSSLSSARILIIMSLRCILWPFPLRLV